MTLTSPCERPARIAQAVASAAPAVYFLAVVPVAIVWGTGLAALTALLSAVAYDYLFIPPAHTLKIPACKTLLR